MSHSLHEKKGMPLPGVATVLLTVVAAAVGWMIWQAAHARRQEDETARLKNTLFEADAVFGERVQAIDMWVAEGADAIPEAIRATESSSPRVRSGAAIVLGRIQPASRESVATMVRLLDDPDAQVRESALAGLLGVIESEPEELQSYMPRMLRMLEDPDEGVRTQVLSAVDELPFDTAARSELAGLLRSSQPHARQLAVKLVPAPAPQFLDTIRDLLNDPVPDVRDEAFRALAASGVVTRDEAIGALSCAPSRREACNVLAIFGRHAAPAVEALRRELRTEDDNGRNYEILRALGAVGPAAEPAIADVLDLVDRLTEPEQDDQPAPQNTAQASTAVARRRIRTMAVECLIRISQDHSAVLSVLREDLVRPAQLIGPEWGVSRSAGELLGRHFPELAREEVPRLVVQLKDSESAERKGLLCALAGIGPEAAAAVPALVELIEGSDSVAAWYALQALSRIGPAAAEAAPVLLENLHNKWISPLSGGPHGLEADVLETLSKIGVPSEAGERLIIELIQGELIEWKAGKRSSSLVLNDAVSALARVGAGSDAAHDALLKVLDALDKSESEDSLRGTVLLSLVELRARQDEALDLIMHEPSVLPPPAFTAGTASIRALGELTDGADRSVPILVTYLEGGNPDVQIAAAESLARLGPRARAAVPALTKMARQPILRDRRHWSYVLSSEIDLTAISQATLTDPGRMQVSEVAAIPLAAAARAALERIQGLEPVAAPRPE